MATPHRRVGVAVTTYGRPQILIKTLAEFRRYTPPDIPIVVVDDGTVPPCPHATFRFDENRGIAAAKNKCLEILAADLGVDHLFLFDSDTYPIVGDWWRPYVESDQPHLMYQFPSGPAHWEIRETFRDDQLVAYDRPRGAMLYVHRDVLDTVGGMHVAWGKHGGEHGDWSDRIHKAGLTRHRYADVTVTTVHCRDEDENTISSVNWRQHQHWRTVDPDRLPLFAEYREQPVPVLVPRRADHGWRDRLWKHLLTTRWDVHNDYRIVEGHHDEGPFNRSAAINTAAAAAGNWDVCLIADSDTWVPNHQLDAAVSRARETGRLTAAFTSVVELSEPFSRAIVDGTADWADFSIDKIRTEAVTTQSSMLAVPRTLFDRAGGFDEKFVGWGGEDGAFWCAAKILAGEPERIDGHAFHLWHEPAPDKANRQQDPGWRANNARWQQYTRARTERDLQRLR